MAFTGMVATVDGHSSIRDRLFRAGTATLEYGSAAVAAPGSFQITVMWHPTIAVTRKNDLWSRLEELGGVMGTGPK